MSATKQKSTGQEDPGYLGVALNLANMFEQSGKNYAQLEAVIQQKKYSSEQAHSLLEFLQKIFKLRGYDEETGRKITEVVQRTFQSKEEPAKAVQPPSPPSPTVYKGTSSTAIFYKQLLKDSANLADGDTPKILVVEDDPACRAAISERLKPMGYFVTAVGDGESAVKEMEHQTFSLIVLDLNLPGMHGLDILEKLSLRKKRIPVVLCTGHAEMAVMPQVEMYGPIRTCEKPINGKKLVRDVTSLLKTGAEQEKNEKSDPYF